MALRLPQDPELKTTRKHRHTADNTGLGLGCVRPGLGERSWPLRDGDHLGAPKFPSWPIQVYFSGETFVRS